MKKRNGISFSITILSSNSVGFEDHEISFVSTFSEIHEYLMRTSNFSTPKGIMNGEISK